MYSHRNDRVLTLDQVKQAAPSAFATQAFDGVSARYAFIPTSRAIEAMMANGFVPTSASQSITRIPGGAAFAKHMIRFRQQDAHLTAVGDSVLETVLTNSHNGTSAYDISLGVLKLACTNGLIVSAGTVQNIHVRHTGNIVDEVINASFKLIGFGDRVRNAITQWSQIQLTPAEQNDFARAALAIRYHDNPELGEAFRAERLLMPHRSDDNKPDLWNTFNRVQENAVRGGTRGIRTRTDENGQFAGQVRVRSREVKGIDQNIRLNRELWTLAEDAARLKTGA